MTIPRRPGTEPLYGLFERWRNECLIDDGSILTPGRSIWDASTIDDLHARFVDSVDEGSGTFFDKLNGQLDGASDATIQLAAECIAVHLMGSVDMKVPTKLDCVERVLGWMSEPARIPAAVEAAFANGIASAGVAYKTLRYWQVAQVLVLAKALKELTRDERANALGDPWRFKELLFDHALQAAHAQRNMLLHLLFPDDFETTVSDRHKRKMVNAFEQHVPADVTDVDRQLASIRSVLEAQYDEPVNFYSPHLRTIWDEGPSEAVTKAPPEAALTRDARRHSVQGARDTIEALLPGDATRRALYELLAKTIEKAHEVSPASWSVSLFKRAVRMNVGVMMTLDVTRRGVRIFVDPDRVDSTIRERLEQATKRKHELVGLPGYVLEAGDFGELAADIAAAHLAFVDRALQRSQKTAFYRSYSPSVVELLEEELDIELPRPDYTPALEEASDDAKPVWKISPEIEARLWPIWRDEGIATVGWDELGDLTDLDESGFEDRREQVLAAHPDWSANGLNQAWKFRTIPVGARIVANRGTNTVLGVGTVVDGYFFDPEAEEHQHRLRVRWDDMQERGVDFPGWRRTLIQLKPDDLEQILADDDGEDLDDPEPDDADPTQLDFAGVLAALDNEGLQFPEEVVASYLLALQAKRFVLLSGISGTGKTQLAIQVARAFQTRSGHDDMGAERGLPRRVLPYMQKYHRFSLNAAFVERHPELLDAIDEGPLRVRIPGRDAVEQSFYRKPGTDSCFVLLSGEPRMWFEENLAEGDTFLLDVEEDADGVGSVLTIRLPNASTAVLSAASEVIPVRPDWTDARGLLGFHNPLLGTYVMTPTLRLLLTARDEAARAKREERPAKPFFLVLDEMNLARVEHYFSDFLSAMESGEPIPLHDDPRIEEENGDDEPVPRRLRVPKNLYVTGTVNVDETTYMFSPKVLDRAFTLEFNDVDLRGFRPREDLGDVDESLTPLSLERFRGTLLGARKPGAEDWRALREHEGGALSRTLEDLNELLAKEHRHFGYRVASEIARFVNLAAEQAERAPETLWTALDVAILSKVLVKLHGMQQELEDVLVALHGFCQRGRVVDEPPTTAIPEATEPPKLPRCTRKLERMLLRLRQQGFTSFIE